MTGRASEDASDTARIAVHLAGRDDWPALFPVVRELRTRLTLEEFLPRMERQVAAHAYELWESAGLLRAAGDVLCARVRDVLEAFSAEAGRRLPARIALVDFTGLTVVGSTEPHWVTS